MRSPGIGRLEKQKPKNIRGRENLSLRRARDSALARTNTDIFPSIATKLRSCKAKLPSHNIPRNNVTLLSHPFHAAVGPREPVDLPGDPSANGVCLSLRVVERQRYADPRSRWISRVG